MEPENVTQETRRHIQRFEAARRELERSVNEVHRNECELSNAANALGKFLSPDDAAVGETFHIWYGASLLSVCKTKFNDYCVKWRTRSPKDFLGM